MKNKETKKCRVCGYEKEIRLFGKNKISSDGLQSECKSCAAKRSFNYVATRGQHGVVGHNVLYEEKEKMLGEHNNMCDICGELVDMSTSRVDHDHVTGQLRGILCDDCNHGLGMFKDNLSYLYSAIEYLEHFMFDVDKSKLT